ncbi:hypothetical protein QYE76_023624 [Lolium multiflorum]|uniref:Transposase (putative) gypsy type domain-containing protein n=1 Tax=Lolium multiflorum TaxID=4521 RepID=A0AAD8VSF9_LOLMU|nr:hypothetical protein QYE76_023624 [Lolium multiflorum]
MDKIEISGWERSKISNQDQKSLKKLGLMKKKDSLIFPGDESFLSHSIRYRLTPNSILHISIFITLCECFLGTHPHWGLWKRIFYLWRNNSRNVVYNMGGVCMCVRPNVDYFDVKFPDSVQGWCKRWLYIREEYVNDQEYGIAPFDGAAEILRRRSWDAEASAEEKAATDALMKHIHQLQNTHEGGEVDERVVVTDDSQESSRPESEAAGSQKSAASSEKESESDPSEYGRSGSPPPAVSPRNKRKRDEVEDSDTSNPTGSPAEEASPEEESTFFPYDDAGSVSSDKIAQQIKREEGIIARFDTQNRCFVRRMGEEFTLHEAEEDRLLDTLSILELQGDLACTNISDARAAFTRLFPHFFPKQTQPQIFSELVKRLLPRKTWLWPIDKTI